MSCKNCEEKPMENAYYRWKNANIEIIACKEHWFEIQGILNLCQGIMEGSQDAKKWLDELLNKLYKK